MENNPHNRHRYGGWQYPEAADNDRQRGREYLPGGGGGNRMDNDNYSGYGNYDTRGHHQGYSGYAPQYRLDEEPWQGGPQNDEQYADRYDSRGPRYQCGGSPEDRWSQGGGHQRHQGHRHQDPDYHQWRSEQIRNLDRDYEQYRQERYRNFASDFDKWRSTRLPQGQSQSAGSDKPSGSKSAAKPESSGSGSE